LNTGTAKGLVTQMQPYAIRVIVVITGDRWDWSVLVLQPRMCILYQTLKMRTITN